MTQPMFPELEPFAPRCDGHPPGTVVRIQTLDSSQDEHHGVVDKVRSAAYSLYHNRPVYRLERTPGEWDGDQLEPLEALGPETVTPRVENEPTATEGHTPMRDKITGSERARRLLQDQLDAELAAVAWSADYDGATGAGDKDTHAAALNVARDLAHWEGLDPMWADIIVACYLTARTTATEGG